MATPSPFNYHRRLSSMVHIGSLEIGVLAPIAIQSMANCATMERDLCIEQAKRIDQLGGNLFRYTTQGVREAENLGIVKSILVASGINMPIVADVHFNPQVADVAASLVDKVRINPGNYVDSVKTFKTFEYTDSEYAAELDKIRQRFIPFLNICRDHQTAIRIGVNHGSLSDRIMSRYGDTPKGLVESCMEFLRICKEERFHDVVISIKASNTVVMVQTVRLLVATMDDESMHYPLHLGVTEAGSGEDGRIKSAVGIGALLSDGMGDTIRVSLSEDPEKEIPVARDLVNYITARKDHPHIACSYVEGGKSHLQTPIVMAHSCSNSHCEDLVYDEQPHYELSQYPVEQLLIESFFDHPDRPIVLTASHINPVGWWRAIIAQLRSASVPNPLIIHRYYPCQLLEQLQLQAASDMGLFFIDKIADGIMISGSDFHTSGSLVSTSFAILQAARARMTQTEYISCPGCGRTLFDLQNTVALVKRETSHLTHLKIAIMGCIVNGPGEMADADYGYVGAARGKVSLYKGQQCIASNIVQEQALERLIACIKQFGDWKDR